MTVVNEILSDIAKKLPELERQRDELKEAIDALQEAGEDVSKLRTTLAEVNARLTRWRQMLQRRKVL